MALTFLIKISIIIVPYKIRLIATTLKSIRQNDRSARMTKDEILEMLKNYELYKMRAQIDNFMQRRGDGSWYQRVFELEKFVAALPIELNKIIKMHFFQKKSLREVGKEVNLAHTTVNDKIQLAVKYLVACYSDKIGG